MSSTAIEKFPLPEGRFSFTKKEFLTLILEAIEEYRISTETPKQKRMMIQARTLSNYICYGSLRRDNFLGQDKRRLGSLLQRVNRWMIQFEAEKSGKSWIITPGIISGIRKEAGLKKSKQIIPNRKYKISIDYTNFFEEKTITKIVFSCKLCREVFKEKEELLKHFEEHKLGEFK